MKNIVYITIFSAKTQEGCIDTSSCWGRYGRAEVQEILQNNQYRSFASLRFFF